MIPQDSHWLFSTAVNAVCVDSGRRPFALLLYDVGSLGAFLAVYDVERYLLTLIESLEALALNCAEVNKNVFTLVSGNKSVPFAFVEPLYGTLCH